MEEPIKEGEEAENKEEAVEDRVSENFESILILYCILSSIDK